MFRQMIWGWRWWHFAVEWRVSVRVFVTHAGWNHADWFRLKSRGLNLTVTLHVLHSECTFVMMGMLRMFWKLLEVGHLAWLANVITRTTTNHTDDRLTKKRFVVNGQRSSECEIGFLSISETFLSLHKLYENCLNCFYYRRNCMSFADIAVMSKLNGISAKIVSTMSKNGFSAPKRMHCFHTVVCCAVLSKSSAPFLNNVHFCRIWR